MSVQKSLVLVTVDCLRADHVGFMGYNCPTTPFVDSLAAESFVFPSAIVAGAPTYYSFPAIMASRYPLALGRDLVGLAPDEPSLATVLKQAGYTTAAFSAANPYITPEFGYDQGFDTFRDFWGDRLAGFLNPVFVTGNSWKTRLNQKLQSISSSNRQLKAIYNELYFQYLQRWKNATADQLDVLRCYPAADAIVDQAETWLVSIDKKPFFLWLHLMDPHAPYYPTQKALDLIGNKRMTPFRARYLNSLWVRSDVGPKRLSWHREEVASLYDAGIRWVDAQMARLVDVLRNCKLWDDCIFAFTADHGEEFLEHGGCLHAPKRLMEELIHVPLLVRVPGVRRNDLSSSPFSLIGLAPTLLDAAGVMAPASFRGRSYWQQMRQGENFDEAVISEAVAYCLNPYEHPHRMRSRTLAVRESRFKLLLQFDPPRDFLYDLEADPNEQKPLPDTAEKPVRRRLLEHAYRHLQRSINERDTGLRLQTRLRELRLEWSKLKRTESEISASPVAS